MQKRPRQTDVAKLAGVSPATVSVILNNRLDGNVRISAETRARVLDAVEQLGYVTDPVARSLAGGRGSILGVFTYEAIFPRQLHHCYYPFLLGMEEEAAQLGYDLLLLTSTGNTDRRRTIYQGNINRLRIANGTVIRMPAQPNTVYEEEIARLIAEQYPFVAVGEHEWSNGAFSSVTADYATATANVVRIMLAQGHRRVAYWAPQHVGQDHRACYAGYLMAHRQLGLAHVAMPAQQFPATHITTTLLQHLLAEGTTA
ncbi:MAG TPA: LacI family DNA-binding transcriptional regulator, partial [Caldilineaceae bacterium]|nr:LacI family DNA-binding transcriptional regulator [Caldilineaceae bacterium]